MRGGRVGLGGSVGKTPPLFLTALGQRGLTPLGAGAGRAQGSGWVTWEGHPHPGLEPPGGHSATTATLSPDHGPPEEQPRTLPVGSRRFEFVTQAPSTLAGWRPQQWTESPQHCPPPGLLSHCPRLFWTCLEPQAPGLKIPPPSLWESCPWLFRWLVLPLGPACSQGWGTAPWAALAPLSPRWSLLPISETLVPDCRASGLLGGQQSLEVTPAAESPLPRSQCPFAMGPGQLPLGGRPGPAGPARGLWRLEAGSVPLGPRLTSPL